MIFVKRRDNSSGLSEKLVLPDGAVEFMKILYFIKGLGLGGAERHVVDCAIASRDAGHEVSVGYILPDKDHFVTQLKSANIQVEFIGSSLLTVSRYLSRTRPDIVHAHLTIPVFYSRLLKPLFKYKLVVTYHNVFKRQKSLARIGERLLHRADDAGISCSAEVASSLPWSTVVIENGILISDRVEDRKPILREKLGLDRHSVVILCIANLVPKKNHALLCRAFADLRDQIDTDCHCILVGQDGTERTRLERLVYELGCSDSIHFWGADPDAGKLAFEADIFCLASDFEGLPLSLLEAMSAGIPSVVTGVGGMPGVVVDGVHGRVVAKGDQAGLTAALAKLSTDSVLRAELGGQARSHVVSNYDVRMMFQRLAEIYSRLMQR